MPGLGLVSLTHLAAAVLGVGILLAVYAQVPASRLRRAFVVLGGASVVWNLLHIALRLAGPAAGTTGAAVESIAFATRLAGGLLVLALAAFAWAYARPADPTPPALLWIGGATAIGIPLAGASAIASAATETGLAAANVVALGLVTLAILHREVRSTREIGRQRVLLYLQTAAFIGIATSLFDLATSLSRAGPGLILARQVSLAPVGNLLGETIMLLALLRHRLLGTTLPLRRALSYLTLTLVLGLAYQVVFTGIFRTAEVLYVSLFAATAVITFFLGPLQRGVERVTGGLFYRIDHAQKELLEGLSATIVTAVDEAVLADATRRTLTLLLDVRWVGVWCLRRAGGHFEAPADLGGDLPLEISRDHPVLAALGAARGFLALPDAKAGALELLERIGGSAVVSLFARGRVVGIVVLGPRIHHETILSEEKDLLRMIANQVAVAIDASLLHRERLEAEKLALIGRMAAGLAHEVKNPLGAIRGAAQLLADEVRPPSRRFLQVIQEETERLDALVRKFLATSRPQAPRLVRVELARLLERVVAAHTTDPSSAGMTVELLGVDPGAVVLADPDALVQIVVNLLTNAREAAGGHGTVTLRLGPGSAPDSVALVVADSGPGIPREIARQLFEPFTTTKPTGSGLGLALARQLARSMRGSLVLDTSEKGAAFRLELSRYPDARAQGEVR